MPCSAAWWGVFWAIFSNLPQPILAVPAYLFVETFRHLLPLGTGAAAGAMIFMVRRFPQLAKRVGRLTLRCVACVCWQVFAELIPDALESMSASAVGHIVTVSVASMVGLQLVLENQM